MSCLWIVCNCAHEYPRSNSMENQDVLLSRFTAAAHHSLCSLLVMNGKHAWKHPTINQSRVLQSLGPVSPFDLIAVFHQETTQTKADADRHNHHQETVFLHEANKSALSRHVNNQIVKRKLLLRLTLRDKIKFARVYNRYMFGSFVAVSISDSCWHSAGFPLITCVTLVACVVLQKQASEAWLIPFVFETLEVQVQTSSLTLLCSCQIIINSKPCLSQVLGISQQESVEC